MTYINYIKNTIMQNFLLSYSTQAYSNFILIYLPK